MNITILGGGNMARAITGGLVSHGHAPASITVIDHNQEKRDRLSNDYGINTKTVPHDAIKGADVIILAVKPQGLAALLADCGPNIIARQPLVISILSGIRLQRLQSLLPGLDIVRAMPNTPARVNAGMTLLTAAKTVSSAQLSMAQQLFQALGQTYVTTTEREFEQLTALTGCGPAFVFYLVQAFTTAMQEIAPGLNALPLAQATFEGALTLMQQETADPATLIAQVAPKGGMTEQSMKVLYAAKLEVIFKETLNAAIQRGDELAAI